MQLIELQKRNHELRIPDSFKMGSKCVYFYLSRETLKRETLSLPSNAAIKAALGSGEEVLSLSS